MATCPSGHVASLGRSAIVTHRAAPTHKPRRISLAFARARRVGRLQCAPTTTQAGVITFTSPDGVDDPAWRPCADRQRHVPDLHLMPRLADRSYSYDAATGQGTISQPTRCSIGDPLSAQSCRGGGPTLTAIARTPSVSLTMRRCGCGYATAVAAGSDAAETGNVLDGSA